MGKLIIKLDNEVIDHIELKQGDSKIGRKPGCDIFLDNLSVSGEHANLFTIGEDSFIQDLGSTNGTFINNKRVTKHHLGNGDAITIGKYTLVYVSDSVPRQASEFAKTVVLNPVAKEEASEQKDLLQSPRTANAKPLGQGMLYILSGVNSGKRIELVKTVTNLGKIGKRAGTITRRTDGYFLSVEGADEAAKLNGRAVLSQGVVLKNGDVIEISGTRLQFYYR